MNKPTLIILQGKPATGKTIIGKKIAELLNLPFFSRDIYKEKLYDVFGESNEETIKWSKKLGSVSFEILYTTIRQILTSGNSCVVETAWIPSFCETVLKKILKETHSKCIQVYLHCDEDIRTQRFLQRAKTDRHPAHMDIQRIEGGYISKIDKHPPLSLNGQTITFDTTNSTENDIDLFVESLSKEIK